MKGTRHWRVLLTLALVTLGAGGCEWFSGQEPGAALCVTDADCVDGGVCDPDSHHCVECLQDADCPLGSQCDKEVSQCVGCIADADCAGDLVCDTESNLCVECLADANCGEGGQCDEGKQICIECTDDADCAYPDVPCAFAACIDGQCVTGAVPDGLPCDDGDACTAEDTCADGECVPGMVVPGCIPGDCATLPDGAACEDGQECTLDDFCMNGKCQGGMLDPACAAQDEDGDGFTPADGDCDDQDPAVHPAAEELCGTWMDEDCDGQVDEGCGEDCFPTGCSGEICASEPMESDCMWRPEYDCLQFSACGNYGPDGSCAWLQTDAYLECIAGFCLEEDLCWNGMDDDCDGLVDEGCEQECWDDGQCPLGWICEMTCDPNGQCWGTCVPGQGNGCEESGGKCFPLWDANGEWGMCPEGWMEVDLSGCMDGEVCCLDQGLECNSDADCPVPPDLCTYSWCENGICMYGTDPGCGGECTADSDCPAGMICEMYCGNGWCSGVCVPGQVPCASAWDCDDGNDCTLDFCKQGLCVHEPDPQCSGLPCGGFAGFMCPDGQFCLFPDGTCEWADMMGTCMTPPGACSMLWAPVCGCDGVTYSNKCMMWAAGMSKAYDGECSQGNLCAEKGGFCAEMSADGFLQCPEGSYATDLPGCGDWSLCCLPEGPGECQDTCDCYDIYGMDFSIPCPLMCPNCGNYWSCEGGMCKEQCGFIPPEVSQCTDPTQCQTDADCAVSSDDCTKGYCENGVCVYVTVPGCGGWCWSSEMCPNGQFCLFDGCYAETGTCTALPGACPWLWAPVCGCDGVTYANECIAWSSGATVAYEGECQEECVPEGESFNTMQPVFLGCCPGLTAIQNAWIEDTGACAFEGNAFMCAQCGNGECGPGENPCNCAEDCTNGSQCVALEQGSFGACAMVLGYSWNGQTCALFSGCSCGAFCNQFYPTYQKCMDSCGPQAQECKVINPYAWGACDMLMGVGFDGVKCVYVSGCGCGSSPATPSCDGLFQTMSACQAACLNDPTPF